MELISVYKVLSCCLNTTTIANICPTEKLLNPPFLQLLQVNDIDDCDRDEDIASPCPIYFINVESPPSSQVDSHAV